MVKDIVSARDMTSMIPRSGNARSGNARSGNARCEWESSGIANENPTEEEVKRAQERGAVLTKEDRAAAAAASEQQGPSEYVGVSWNRANRRYVAVIRHDGKQQSLGCFDDERKAARAVDRRARRVRGEDAHGGRAGGKNWLRLNFPTKQEVARAKALGMPAAR